jgi:hypothetical protein
MAARKSPSAAMEPATPASVETPPAPYNGHHDHSFTLQAIMELKGSAGKVEATLEANTRAIEKLDAKLDKIEEKLSGVTHKIYAAGILLTALVGIGVFVVDKAWDIVTASYDVTPAASPVIPPAKK